MIHVWISYFYKVRFMSPEILPVSTAMWDPSWWHGGNPWVDKNGVLCGLRIPVLSPWKIENPECQKKCPLQPDSCRFIKDYRDYLRGIDKNELQESLLSLSGYGKQFLNLQDWPDICLLVHEAPGNKCSERGPLLDYFNNELGIGLLEWDKKEREGN